MSGGAPPRGGLPLTHWEEHRAPKTGQPYLANPMTGETTWLYSRFTDHASRKDFLVNKKTKERLWVTRQNEFLCPRPPDMPATSDGTSPSFPARPQPVAAQTPDQARRARDARSQPSSPRDRRRGGGSSGGSGSRVISVSHPPPSLGLATDEELMMVVDSGRYYIRNKRTNHSKWLSPETVSAVGLKVTPSHPTNARTPADISLNRSNGPSSRTTSTSAPTTTSQNPTSSTPSSSIYPSPTKSPNAAALDIQSIFRAYLVRRSRIVEKLVILAKQNTEVINAVAPSSKHDISFLRAYVNATPDLKNCPPDFTDDAANQRLMELGEYLTQRMLKVDAVDAAGIDFLRLRRKETVKKILALTDEVDALRSTIKAKKKR